MITLTYPIDKIFITQRFGARPEVYQKFHLAGHNGIDFRTRFLDTPLGRRYVIAAHGGVIEEIRYDLRGYGIHIRQRLPDGSLLIYGHLKKPYVGLEEKVNYGQRIGLTDNTGFSSAPHLHFELRLAPIDTKNGFAGAVDPMKYFI